MILKRLFAVIFIINIIFLFSCSDSESNPNLNLNPNDEIMNDETTADRVGVDEVENELEESVIINATPEKSYDLDIVYKTFFSFPNTNTLKIDIFYPTTIKYPKTPLVVGFHGGGWIAGDKSQIMYIFSPIIQELRDQGYAVATVQYRFISESISFPAPAEDCIDALLYLKNNADKYNFDVNSIGVMGYSAGAQLAMLSAYAQNIFSATGETVDIKYCLSFAGPSTMYGEELQDYSRNTLYLLENLFKGSYAEKEEQYKKGSAHYYINGDTKKVPLLLTHDEHDDVIPYSQSTAMYKKMTESNIPCELLTLNGIQHQIDFGRNYFNYGSFTDPTREEAIEAILDFIYKYSGK